jgi:hypothetical protein
MYRLILSLIALLALYSIEDATAAERVRLFQDYLYGEPLDEIRKDPEPMSSKAGLIATFWRLNQRSWRRK